MSLSDETNIFDLIKDRVNIVDVLGRILKLKRVGSRWVSLCPFHKDTMPSFYVNEDRQNYRCFGCGAGGDVIAFYAKYYNLTPLEAVEKLASEYGIDLPDRGRFAAKSKKDGLYEINAEAGRLYYSELRKDGNPGRGYMDSRGITEEARKAFALGYAPGRPFLSEGFAGDKEKAAKAVELGLIMERDGNYRDRYRNRLMFPILNAMNKVVGFGARAIDPEDNPKYINSSESPIFAKKKNLYGINLTKDAIMSEGFVILVEGYMDVIALYQFGVKNVTATLGTALTGEHARLIKRFTKNVILSFDSDDAGVKSAIKGIDILRGEGLSVKVLVVTDGKDPDEFIRKNGREAFDKAVREALPAMDFMLKDVRRNHDLATDDGMVGFLKEAALTLRKAGPVEADFYIKKLAEDTGISEGAIRMEVRGDSRDEAVSAGPKADRDRFADSHAGFSEDGHGDDVSNAGRAGGLKEDAALKALQKNMIALAAHDPSFLDEIRASDWVFVTPVYSRIYRSLVKMLQNDPEGDPLEWLADGLDEADLAAFTALRRGVMIGESPRHQLKDCLVSAELYDLEMKQKEKLDILKLHGSDDELANVAAEELRRIQSDILALKQVRV